jgi:biopolymer transport protein ExbB/TolQ
MDSSIIIIFSIAIILLIIFILLSRIKIVKRKKVQEQQDNAKKVLLKEMHKVNKKIKNPKESLLELNKVAKEFFREYLKENKEDTYVELEQLLKRKNQKDMIGFCEKMDFLLYSGKPVTKSQALEMIEELRKIIKSKQLK